MVFNSIKLVLIRVIRGLKKSKKPTPLKIAQLPQISTEMFDEGVYISPRSSPGLNGPLNATIPENHLYCHFPGSGKKRFLTVLTGFNGGLTVSKTKKVLKAQKRSFSQPRKSGFSVFSPRNTRIYMKRFKFSKRLALNKLTVDNLQNIKTVALTACEDCCYTESVEPVPGIGIASPAYYFR